MKPRVSHPLSPGDEGATMAMSTQRRKAWAGVGAGVVAVLAGAALYLQSLGPEVLKCDVMRTDVGQVVYEMPVCE